MSEHKIGLSNWTAEDKKLYWQRRNKGLRGQLGYVNIHHRIKDEKGKEQLVPIGYTGGFISSRMQGRNSSKTNNPAFTKGGSGRTKQRALARNNGRGD